MFHSKILNKKIFYNVIIRFPQNNPSSEKSRAMHSPVSYYNKIAGMS
jgi:hypothetical protein